MEQNDLSYRLIRAMAQVPKLLRPPRFMDIRRSEMMALGCIWHMTQFGKSTTTPSQIGEMMEVSRPAVTAQLNHLEEQGYIQREIDPNDKRRTRVRCTEKGRQSFIDSYMYIQRMSSLLIQALGKEKVEELIDLLHQVNRVLSEQQPSASFTWDHPSTKKGAST